MTMVSTVSVTRFWLSITRSNSCSMYIVGVSIRMLISTEKTRHTANSRRKAHRAARSSLCWKEEESSSGFARGWMWGSGGNRLGRRHGLLGAALQGGEDLVPRAVGLDLAVGEQEQVVLATSTLVRWVITMIVEPWALRLSSVCTSERSPASSRLELGSSSTMKRGLS
jgi:hypothetical protein